MSQSKLIPETERAKYTRHPPDGIIDKCFRLRHFRNGTLVSDKVEIGGLKWKLGVAKKSFDEKEFLYVSIIPDAFESSLWNIEFTAEYILHHDEDEDNNHHYVLRDLAEQGCFLTPWDEMMDEKKGFIERKQIHVVLRVTIWHGLRCNPTFDFASSGDIRADVVLKIKRSRIHVNKQYLGLYSPVFQDMFFGDSAEKGNDEIRLKGVDYYDFIELLRVIYPSQKSITEDTHAEGLIELADRFQITSVIQCAEDVLIKSNEGNIRFTEKIRIADKFKLFRLLANGISDVNSIEDVQKVKDDPCYESLSDATKIALLERRKTALISSTSALNWSDWKLGVEMMPLNEKEFLLLSLIPRYLGSSPWNIELAAEFILHHSTNNDKNVSQMLHYVLRDDFTNLERFEELYTEPEGCYLIPWDEMMDKDKGFIENKEISVEIRLTILEGVRCNRAFFDFSSPGDIRSDVVLLIEGKPVHANKQYLGLFSPVFHAMFFGDFAEKVKNEIEMKDVDYEQFIELLRVIYPSRKRITDRTAEYLIVLADRFEITSVIHDAVDVLISSWRHTPMETLRIADQYHLYRLMENALSALEHIEDVQAIKNDPIYEGLSETTKIALRERELKFAERSTEGETSDGELSS